MSATPRLRRVEGVQAPQSLAAEEALLGGLLIDPSAWDKIAEAVGENDFSRPDHQVIFEAIRTLASAGKPGDIITVSGQLERAGKLDAVGGLAYLGSLARETPTAANVRAYADIVRERSRLRRLRDAGADIERAIADGNTSEQVAERIGRTLETLQGQEAPSVLQVEPACAWATRTPPAPRDWVWQDRIPAGRVTSFLGDGGLGKTTIGVQVAVHTAMSRSLYGVPINGGAVMGIFCEDEQDELERKTRAVCAAEQIDLADLQRLYLLSRDGQDNLLCTFEREQIVFTRFYRELEAAIADIKPRLLVLDTLADLFAGDFMSTPQVRQFLKVALGGLCVRHGCAVLLLAHPSASGMSTGTGAGYSVAWNNSVRSRLYLRRPQTDDKDAARDRRIIEVKKANLGPDGLQIPLVYSNGCFVPDLQPIEEGTKPARAPRTDTRLAVAAVNQLRAAGPPGKIVSFGQIFEPLKKAGDLSSGNDETLRKKLQRMLRQLVEDGLLDQTNVPRGYRLVPPPTVAP